MVSRGISSGKSVKGKTNPQIAPGKVNEASLEKKSVAGRPVRSARDNPDLARKTSELLLSETKATLPDNVQNHIKNQSTISAERGRREIAEFNNLYGKKSYE